MTGGRVTHRRSRNLPPAATAPPRPVANPAKAAEVAASLQATCGGWLILWSEWRQAFTAFAAFAGAELVVIDEPTVDRLLSRIGQVEMAAGVGRPVLS